MQIQIYIQMDCVVLRPNEISIRMSIQIRIPIRTDFLNMRPNEISIRMEIQNVHPNGISMQTGFQSLHPNLKPESESEPRSESGSEFRI